MYTIREMLRNETYIGNTVQGKYEKISYKIKKSRHKPHEEWIVVENMHDPIIDKDTWYSVQSRMNNQPTCQFATGTLNPFSKKVYCKYCGKAFSKTKSKQHEYLVCSDKQQQWRNCDNRSLIRLDLLEKDIIKQINENIEKYKNGNLLKQLNQEMIDNKYFNEKNYTKVNAIPGDTYAFNTYECTNGATLTYTNRKFNIDTSGKTECNVYFNRIGELQELVFMQEADTGEDGYTIGKKYQRVASAPTTGYRYIGYKCDSAEATVTYLNNKFEIESEIETTCYAYFNKNTGGAQINYFIEGIDEVYNSVVDVPTFGYTYNSAKSKCLNGSTITVDPNNKVTVSSTDDVCDIYFDLRKRDVQLEIYVMNRETGKWEVGKVPKVGYEIYNAGCNPNNASIEYKDGKLEIEAEGPTVCTVYFR